MQSARVLPYYGWSRSRSARPTSTKELPMATRTDNGLGRAHKGRTIKLLIADQNIRVIDLQGQLIRELTLDPTRNYQPLTRA